MTDDSKNGAVVMPYGNQTVSAELGSARCLGTLDVQPAPALADADRAVRDALESPIGLEAPLFADFKPGETVCVVVSDSFRQTRADLILPRLIENLIASGIREEDIFFLYSTGTHRGPTNQEQREILGPAIFDRFEKQCYIHDPHNAENHISVGETSRGTPVEINRRLHEADRVVATGTVVLHYFGGFGGGRKSIVPGLASARTIAHNHAMNLHPTKDRLDPKVAIGVTTGNPVAEDMLEATKLTRVDAIVNTVLNKDGDLAAVFAGDLEAAHEAACRFARECYAVPITERADLVIAASPHTKNFVQTHKALFNAYQAMSPGGRIVLLAPCTEGLGGEQFSKWLSLGDRSDIIAALREHSEINGQTALSTREKAPATLMVTELDAADVALLGARACENLQDAVDLALAELKTAGRAHPTCYSMPTAAFTVPIPPG